MEHAKKTDEANLVKQWVTFKLGEETYAINVMQVQEVLRVTEIAPVPGAPDFVLGIINLRGNVVTVMDARKRIHLPPKDVDDDSRIVIIEAGNQVVGLLVDCVAEVIEVQDADIEPAPAVGNDESSKYIHGVVNSEDSLTILMDLDKMLSEDEWLEVAAL
jgi:purine-binding chemotaxis protein CheW